MERWKCIPGYEGIYQASTLGRIRSHPRKTTETSLHGMRHWKCRILKGRGNNYSTGSRVSLWKNGKQRDFLVARLVATAWVDGYESEMTVNHINGDRLDNRIENLEWVTLRENIQHGFRTGLYRATQKRIRLVSQDERAIEFESMAAADRYLGKCRGYVSNQTGRNKNLCGGKFKVEKVGYF